MTTEPRININDVVSVRDLPAKPAGVADWLIGVPSNQGGPPFRAPFEQLPVQPAVQQQIDALIAGQQAGQLVYRTWAELSAVTGSVGEGAQVLDDAGTHTDPVVGGTVANAGQYVWSESPAGWRWVRPDALPLKADKVDVDQLAARPGPGITDMFTAPNMFTDSDFALWTAGTAAGAVDPAGSGTYIVGSAATVAQTVATDGRPAMSWITTSATSGSNLIRYRSPIARLGVSPGDRISASIRIDSGTVVSSARILLRQNKADNSEITGRRQTYSLSAGSVGTRLVRFTAVELDADCASVEFYIDSTGSGTNLVLADAMIASGRVSDYRPPLVGVVTPADLPGAVNALAVESSLEAAVAPNLVSPSSFSVTELSPVASATATPVADSANGVKAWRITWPGTGSEAAVSLGPFSASNFPRGKVSASVNAVKVDGAAAGTARVLLQQFNGGSEITAAREIRNITLTGGAVTAETTSVFDGIALDPSCTSVRLYIGLNGSSGTARSLWFRNPTVYDGTYKGVRIPPAAERQSVVYVSPSGNDNAPGTAGAPKATLDAAIAAIGGNGTVYMLPGTYGSAARITHAGVKGRVEVLGVRAALAAGDYAYPVVNLGIKLAGITKTAGRTKVYQAAVAGLPTLANFNWAYEHGTPEAASEITDHQQPQHRGRAYRLPWFTRIRKTTATELEDALDEIDSSPEPKAFIESGILYFSIASGGDATAADIYIDSEQTMIPTVVGSGEKGAAGSLVIRGLRVMHGGLDLRAFKYAELDEVIVTGARNNCIDYNVLRYGTLEVCCAGSGVGSAGDGLNGHTGAVLYGDGDLYAHDCNDDGFSDHEGCTSRLVGGGLVEFNGGAGITPAFGSDCIARGFVSIRNQRVPGRKHGAYYVTGSPASGSPAETGVDTRARFENCVDIESDTSFTDDNVRSGGATPAIAVCIGCKSIKPTTRAFNVTQIEDCSWDSGGGSATAKHSSTVVKNTTLVT